MYEFLSKFLNETNANITNEFSVSGVYRSLNYTGSLAKFTWTDSFTTTKCSLHFDKLQKNEIHSLNTLFLDDPVYGGLLPGKRTLQSLEMLTGMCVVVQ